MVSGSPGRLLTPLLPGPDREWLLLADLQADAEEAADTKEADDATDAIDDKRATISILTAIRHSIIRRGARADISNADIDGVIAASMWEASLLASSIDDNLLFMVTPHRQV